MDAGFLLHVHPITDFRMSSPDGKKCPEGVAGISLDPGSPLRSVRGDKEGPLRPG